MIAEMDANAFTFVWKIENWRMKNFDRFCSPKFCLNKFLNSLWHLEFEPEIKKHSMKLMCSLIRGVTSDEIQNGLNEPTALNVSFKILLRNSPDEVTDIKNLQTEKFYEKTEKQYENLSWEEHERWLRSSEFIYIICYMLIESEEIKENISNHSDVLLPKYLDIKLNTSVALNSEIKPMQESVVDEYFYFSNKCFAKTVLPMEKKKFFWSLEGILNNPKKPRTFIMRSISCFPDLLIHLPINDSDFIKIKIQTIGGNSSTIDNLMYNVSISDSPVFSSTNDWEYLENKVIESELTLETKVNVDRKTNNLKTCFLCLEIRISKENEVSWIENTPPVFFNKLNAKDTNLEEDQSPKLQDIYDQKLHCDVTLVISERKIEAHKAILSNHSPVFKAMFKTKMLERETNYVLIRDVDEITMCRLVDYMYGKSLQVYSFEDYAKLYTAADKYQVAALRQKCAMNMTSTIAVTNALHMLSLSVSHSDEDLKSCVSEYIVQHMKEIMSLEHWKIFSDKKPLLAKEILEKVVRNLTGLKDI